MVVNVGAYATEIVRAGIESISRGQIEAGLALGLRPLQVFRYVILFPALVHRLSRAVQPVHPADARVPAWSRRFRRRNSRRPPTTCSRAPSAASRSTSSSPASTWCCRCCSPARSAPSIARCSRGPVHAGMIRQFGPAEALFIIEAVRWTLLLSAVAFAGGGIAGLGVALARTAPPAWLRTHCRRLHPVVPGHAAADAAVPGVLRRHRARRRRSIRWSPPPSR